MALSCLVALSLLVLVLWEVDWGTLAQLWAEVRLVPLVGMMLAMGLNHLLRVLRWQRMLGLALPWSVHGRVCTVAFLAILVLPLRLGEAVRPALLLREGVPLERSVTVLATERLLDLLGLLCLLGGVLAVLELPPLILQGVEVVAVAQGTAQLSVLALALALLFAAAMGERWARLPLVGGSLANVARVTRELGTSPRHALSAVLLTAATWLSCILYVKMGLLALPSLPSSWEAAASSWAGIIAASTALPTPGFFGPYEAGAAAALALHGAPRDTASAWALGLHLAYLSFVALAAGPGLLWYAGRSIGAR